MPIHKWRPNTFQANEFDDLWMPIANVLYVWLASYGTGGSGAAAHPHVHSGRSIYTYTRVYKLHVFKAQCMERDMVWRCVRLLCVWLWPIRPSSSAAPAAPVCSSILIYRVDFISFIRVKRKCCGHERSKKRFRPYGMIKFAVFMFEPMVFKLESSVELRQQNWRQMKKKKQITRSKSSATMNIIIMV